MWKSLVWTLTNANTMVEVCEERFNAVVDIRSWRAVEFACHRVTHDCHTKLPQYKTATWKRVAGDALAAEPDGGQAVINNIRVVGSGFCGAPAAAECCGRFAIAYAEVLKINCNSDNPNHASWRVAALWFMPRVRASPSSPPLPPRPPFGPAPAACPALGRGQSPWSFHSFSLLTSSSPRKSCGLRRNRVSQSPAWHPVSGRRSDHDGA